MATKSAQPEPEKLDVEETLEIVDKTLERVKSLYEQYFLGIQKQPPAFLHTDLDRKLRDLGQIQIRNTALRYRFVTLQQKFGSYNAYWRRTLRQIENGTYARSLHKLGRKAVQTGEEIPEEILAAMPKRMRDQVRRDREAALALAKHRKQLGEQPSSDGDFYEEFDNRAPAAVGRVDARGAHVLDEADADLDLDAYFHMVADETAEATHSSAPPQPPEPEPFDNLVTPPRATPTPPAAPAPLRASTLGFGARAPASPNARAAPRTSTDPGTPVPTPLPFAPVGSGHAATATPPTRPSTPPSPTPAASRPAFRPVDTEPGTGAGPRAATQPGPGTPPSATPPSFRPPAIATPATPAPTRTGVVPVMPPAPNRTGVLPVVPPPPNRTGVLPTIPSPKPMTHPDQSVAGASPLGRPPSVDPGRMAPSQITRPNPIAAGAAAQVKPATVETMSGPFAREPSVHVAPRRTKRDTDLDQGGSIDVPMEPTPRPQDPVAVPRSIAASPSRPVPGAPARPTPTPGAQRPAGPPQRPSQPANRGSNPAVPPARPSQPAQRPPPPGMSNDDVNQLYAKYVKAKQMVGETTGPQTYGKLLNTINAQAPKIMEQYKAKGVDFSVVVKDNQVIIRAKPKP